MKIDLKTLIKEIEDFGKDYMSYWGNALAGEASELIDLILANFISVCVGKSCNLIKKNERDNIDNLNEIKEEIADIFIYLILFSKRFNIDLEKTILEKIAIVRKRREGIKQGVI